MANRQWPMAKRPVECKFQTVALLKRNLNQNLTMRASYRTLRRFLEQKAREYLVANWRQENTQECTANGPSKKAGAANKTDKRTCGSEGRPQHEVNPRHGWGRVHRLPFGRTPVGRRQTRSCHRRFFHWKPQKPGSASKQWK